MSEAGPNRSTRNWVSVGIVVVCLAVLFVPYLFDDPPPPRPTLGAMPEVVLGPPPPAEEFAIDTTTADNARQRLSKLVDAQGRSRATGTLLGEPVLLPDTSEAQQWAVQLDSFYDLVEAQALVSQAKKHRDAVWISRVRLDGREEYKVYVGPYTDYQETLADRDELESLLGVVPQVLALAI